jgi:hypothetical protein
MNPDLVSEELSSIFIAFTKGLALCILVLYLVFSVIVLRQTQTMSRVLKTGTVGYFKVAVLAHAALAVITFLALLIMF